MPVTLAEIPLTAVRYIQTDETRALTRHGVPGLEGDILAHMGRRPVGIRIDGVFSGADALDHIAALRQIAAAGEPAPFTADITDSTEVTDVVIDKLLVNQVGGRPDYYSYTVSLKEYVEITEEETAQEIEEDQQRQAEDSQDHMEDNVANNTGTYEVRVELEEGETDYSGISVLVEGTTTDGDDYSLTISGHENGVFTAQNVPDGEYTAVLNSENQDGED